MSDVAIPRIVLTAGEPAGIGPDIIIHTANQSWSAELVVVADPHLLKERAKQIGLPLELSICDIQQTPQVHQPGKLKILPVTTKKTVQTGKLNVENAPYVIQTLEKAAQLCLANQAQALVTGPVHKGIINQAGINFSGHTEFFANYCNVAQTIMLFVVKELKIALATTHLPLAKVSQAITQSHLKNILILLNQEIKKWFGIVSPKIFISGLNPHAGEDGHLGREEIEVISPVLDELKKQYFNLFGPLPADTIFTPKYLNQADVILAMYHDQALPLVKHIGFGHAVNVTLGLPFIRTSVDHGTALDIAGTAAVDPASMAAALELALQHCHR